MDEMKCKQIHLNHVHKVTGALLDETGKQEGHHTAGLGETPRLLIRKRCRYSSLEKFEDSFEALILH